MNKKGLLGLAAFVALVSAFTTAAVMTTTMSITRFGPFFMPQTAWDSLTGGQPGGDVRVYIAGGTTDSLKIGDVVFISDTNKVTKSSTLVNYNAIAGVVVGGTRTSMLTTVVAADVGTLAAVSGQRVVVARRGRTWVRLGSNATVIPGRRLIPSDSIAGRAETISTMIDTASRVFGRNVTAALALSTILVDLNVR